MSDITLNVTVSRDRPADSRMFFFRHEGTECACLDSPGDMACNVLAKGQVLVIGGVWSKMVANAFTAISVRSLE